MKALAHRILYTREAKRNIGKLDPSVRKLVRKAVESLAADPERGKPLSHELAELRSLRTSDYRIVYRVRGGELVVLIVAVGHRREVYKRLGELLGLAGKRK
ncbi:MAG: type II toxin-antitoxin system RelE/ParE family toxin [Candidatus Aminicenantes bacterium]|nr:type II toxin-antitoxin system RelE/ParE family toxin [Candidatus Aminicenantes bacterium]